MPGLLGKARGEGGSCSSGIPGACPHDRCRPQTPPWGSSQKQSAVGVAAKQGVTWSVALCVLYLLLVGVEGAFVSGTVDYV